MLLALNTYFTPAPDTRVGKRIQTPSDEVIPLRCAADFGFKIRPLNLTLNKDLGYQSTLRLEKVCAMFRGTSEVGS